MRKLLFFIFICFFNSLISAQSITVWGEIYAPLSFEEDGKKIGMVTEIVEYLIEDSGVVVDKWIMAPWARAFHEGKTNDNSLLYTVVRTPDREDLFYWIGPISNRTINLYKLHSRSDIIVNSWDDVKRYSIGSLRHAASTETLQAHSIQPELINNLEQNMKKLIAGRVDLIVMLDYSMSFFAQKEGVLLSDFDNMMVVDDSLQYYIVLNKNASLQVVNALKNSFEKMVQNGKIQEIIDKYL